MGLRLYNTMGRELQDFVPIRGKAVGLYGCGPTVYNYAHIGNLRAYVFLDILDKTLSFLGYEITHVMNITDIGHLAGDSDTGEDKMVKTAAESGASVLEIADFYIDAFFKDMESLSIRRPDIICRATDHIDDMIALIARLERGGHTYVAGGNVYYDVSTFADYGRLALLNLQDLKAGARTAVDPNKKNPHDFALWFTKSKFENHALTWDSPWGRGYPGWHIECSAMSMKYLGEQIDIHTGGIDHIPVHHTNEIAQSEGATGRRWVNYWLHNEFLIMQKNGGADKMSKSSGSFITLNTLQEQGYTAMDYRFFLLGAHYRSQIFFSKQALDSARQARLALVQRIARIIEAAGEPAANLSEGANRQLGLFRNALEDDLATPRALAVMQGLIKDEGLSAQERYALILIMDGVLSLNLKKEAEALIAPQKQPDIDPAFEAEITALIAERTAAKKQKNFARADAIRQELGRRGILLTDTPSGTVWKKADML